MEVPARLVGALDLARSALPVHAVVAWGVVGLLAAPVLARRRNRWRLGLRAGACGVVVALVCVWLARPIGGDQPPRFARVDEVNAERQRLVGHPLRIHGCVADRSLERVPGTSRVWFVLRSTADEPHPLSLDMIRATYSGEVPDTFHEGNEVVVEATLTPDGDLDVVPNGILAKSGNRYRSARCSY